MPGVVDEWTALAVDQATCTAIEEGIYDDDDACVHPGTRRFAAEAFGDDASSLTTPAPGAGETPAPLSSTGSAAPVENVTRAPESPSAPEPTASSGDENEGTTGLDDDDAPIEIVVAVCLYAWRWSATSLPTTPLPKRIVQVRLSLSWVGSVDSAVTMRSVGRACSHVRKPTAYLCEEWIDLRYVDVNLRQFLPVSLSYYQPQNKNKEQKDAYAYTVIHATHTPTLCLCTTRSLRSI